MAKNALGLVASLKLQAALFLHPWYKDTTTAVLKKNLTLTQMLINFTLI
jgi:hypothetical protein